MRWRELLDRIVGWFQPRTGRERYMAEIEYAEPEAFEEIPWPMLTNREIEVALYLRQGLSNDEIAVQMGISRSTVKTHVHNLLAKFQTHSRWMLRDILNAADYDPWRE